MPHFSRFFHPSQEKIADGGILIPSSVMYSWEVIILEPPQNGALAHAETSTGRGQGALHVRFLIRLLRPSSPAAPSIAVHWGVVGWCQRARVQRTAISAYAAVSFVAGRRCVSSAWVGPLGVPRAGPLWRVEAQLGHLRSIEAGISIFAGISHRLSWMSWSSGKQQPPMTNKSR